MFPFQLIKLSIEFIGFIFKKVIQVKKYPYQKTKSFQSPNNKRNFLF
jgi:hypothetical protein